MESPHLRSSISFISFPNPRDWVSAPGAMLNLKPEANPVEPHHQSRQQSFMNEPDLAPIPRIAGGLHFNETNPFGRPTPPEIARFAFLDQGPESNPSTAMSIREQTHGCRHKPPERSLRNEPNFAFISIITNGFHPPTCHPPFN